jgi:hypothetical protein
MKQPVKINIGPFLVDHPWNPPRRKWRKWRKPLSKSLTISVRAAARKLNMDPSTVSRIKVHKLGIQARTKTKSPKYLPGQEARAELNLSPNF